MSLASLIGLRGLPTETANALQPIIEEILAEVEKVEKAAAEQAGEIARASIEQVNGIMGAALDRINGAQVVVVATIKLPEVGAKIAEVQGQ